MNGENIETLNILKLPTASGKSFHEIVWYYIHNSWQFAIQFSNVDCERLQQNYFQENHAEYRSEVLKLPLIA